MTVNTSFVMLIEELDEKAHKRSPEKDCYICVQQSWVQTFSKVLEFASLWKLEIVKLKLLYWY